jgi:hypothetical protein
MYAYHLSPLPRPPRAVFRGVLQLIKSLKGNMPRHVPDTVVRLMNVVVSECEVERRTVAGEAAT